MAHYLSNAHDQALKDMADALKLSPGNTVAHEYRGRAFNQKKEFDRAIAEFTEVIRGKPDSWMGYALRGLALELKGDRDKALADYDRRALSWWRRVGIQEDEIRRVLRRRGRWSK